MTVETITTKAAAALLGVTRTRVHALIKVGRLRVVGTDTDGRLTWALLDAAEVRGFRDRPPLRVGRPPKASPRVLVR